MEPFQQLGRSFLVLGAILIALGIAFSFAGKLPFRLGRLPGDIVHRGQHSTFYFPIVSCLLISIAVSIVFWLINHFRR